MAATPPPPKRVRTPQTPRFGPKYDNYEPFSPRRSSRIANRAGVDANLSTESNGSQTPNHSELLTSSSSGLINSAPNSTQAFSPPVSPISPAKRANTRAKRGDLDTLTPRKQRRVKMLADQESDSDHAGSAPQGSKAMLSHNLGAGMLPTPAKTPRKRAVPGEIVKSTARVLFADRPANVEDAMPSMRKSKNRKRMFSLDGQDDGDDEAGKVAIYTDSKEKVPEVDDAEDNPFYTKSGSKNKVKGEGEQKLQDERRSRRPAEMLEEEAEMEKNVKNDEGMIYVFRGRKVYRKFDNMSAAATAANSDTEADSLSISSIIKRKAGAAASEPFTRHSVTPRLLFPNEEQRRKMEERERREEEEALTDIEVPLADDPETGHLQVEGGTAGEEMTTPVKTNFEPATPPSSNKSKKKARGKAREVATHIDKDTEMAVVDEAEVMAHAVDSELEGADDRSELDMPRTRSKKVSPFTSWLRTKPGMAAKGESKGTKREREQDMSEVGGAGSGKRVRSGTLPEAST
ncbi:hypothetical protein NA57DRAFT_57582 [Rhizodiscina lignyota]|uniref:Uncharacterized protein n=1 Tax=Rhizodiscina lignyota TaxID=1504668 RepID=A0A9P4M3Q8_9PEZI|nr:hypothetical protein NA57DRAFT_57582 [Rhizodiscina lignyota]